MLIEYQETKGN